MSFDFSRSKTVWRVTADVLVEARAIFYKEESDPKNGLWCFVYEVKITNRQSEEIQILRRHWIIEDDQGYTEEVKGEGVVGQKPIIPPDHQFRYVSACPLWTPKGAMQGHYVVKTANETEALIEIPRFELDRASHLSVVK